MPIECLLPDICGTTQVREGIPEVVLCPLCKRELEAFMDERSEAFIAEQDAQERPPAVCA